MRQALFSLMFFFAVAFASPMVLAAPPEDMMVETVEMETGSETGSETGTEIGTGSESDTGSDETSGETGLVPVEVETDEDAVEAAKDLYSAITGQNWAMVVAIGLTLLVFAMRKFNLLAKIPTKAIPWVTAALAMVGYVAAALLAPEVVIGQALLEGLAVGAAAVGFWEMALKHVLGTSPAEDAEEVPSTESPSDEAPEMGTSSEDPAKD